LQRSAYERYRNEVHDARPDQLRGLISQAEFLKSGGKLPAGVLATPRSADLPNFGPSNTKIRLAAQPKFPSGPRKRR
jgi:hypothetical protein